MDDDEVGDEEDAHNPYTNPVTYRDLSDHEEGGSSYEDEEEPAAREEGGGAEEEPEVRRGCRRVRSWRG